MVNNSPFEIWNAIISSKKPLCIIDSRFDFDSFGSCYSLKSVLKSKGIELKLIYSEKVPTYALEDFDITEIEQLVDLSTYDFSLFDTLITLDADSISHLTNSKMEWKIPDSIKVINIDHHATNKFFGTLNYVYFKSSTCRLLFDVFVANGVEIDKVVGSYLLKGLLTDSGILQYDEVDVGDFEMVAKIIKLGVSYNDMVRELTCNENADTVKFKRFIYDKMIVDAEKRFAYLAYNTSDLEKEGIVSGQVLVNATDIMRKMSMVDYVFSVRNDANIPNKWWVGFRSRLKDLDVSKYAQALGGGGHKMAAGARLENVETLEDAVKIVLGAVEGLS